MKNALAALLVVLVAVVLAAGQGEATEGSEPKAATDVGRREATKIMTGQCHCGHVKYRAQDPILDHSYCDCRGCQRATGTLKAPFVVVSKTSFTVTAGEPSRFRSDSGVKCDAHGVWNFCPRCGTQVFWVGDKGDKVDIFAGTLDDTALFKPKG